MRIAITARTSPSLVIALGAALAVWLDDHPRAEPRGIVLDISSPPPPIEISSSIATRDNAPPPPLPRPPYAALFVEGATWTLPCVYHDYMLSPEATRPGGELRCVADHVHRAGDATLVRHTCTREHADPRLQGEESTAWYAMTDDGLYRVEPPNGRFRIFARRPHVEHADYTEPLSGAHVVRAITRRGDSWCRFDHVANGDGGSGGTFCISKTRGVIGRDIPYPEAGWTDHCGETF